MKLSVTVWERLQLVRAVGGLTGCNAATLRKAIKALDVLELSDDEKTEIGYRQLGGNMTWENAEMVFDLEIKDKEASALVKRAVREFKGWKGEDARMVVPLLDRIEGKGDDDESAE